MKLPVENDVGCVPHSFKAALLDVFKTKFVNLMVLSIFVFLFFIPLICSDIFFNSYIGGVGQDLSQLTETQRAFRDFYLRIYQGAIDIPLLMLGCLGFGSSMFVFKKYIYGEKAYLVSDFFKNGIKATYKASLLWSFILGLISLLISFNVYGLTAYEFPKLYIVITSIIEGLVFILVFFIYFFCVCSETIYDLPFGNATKNSLLFSGILYGKNLLVFISTFAWIVCYYLFTNIFFQGFSLLVFFFIGAGVLSLVWTTYCLYIFNKYINRIKGVTINNRDY